MWKLGEQTDVHHLFVHPLFPNNHLINVFTFIAPVRSMRRKQVRQHREEEARTKDAGPGGKEAQLQSSAKDRKTGVSSRETVEEQNNTCQRQRHFSIEGVRNGTKNFLPPEGAHPSLQGSTGQVLLPLRAGSGPKHPTVFLPIN